MPKRSRYLLIRMGFVMALLVLGIVLRPPGWSANEGFSYFGDYRTTVVPYSVAFILYAYTLWKIAEMTGFALMRTKVFSSSLRIMTFMLLGLVITPSNFVDSIHMLFGSVLFSLQLIISIWLAGWWMRNWLTIMLVVIELMGGLISFYYLPKSNGLLLQGQAIFQLAFVLLLARILAAKELQED